MTRSLLHRLPDIVALARQRARELRASVTPTQPAAAGHARFSAGHLDPPGHHALQQVSLLCGDELSAMLGLLAGAGHDGPLAGRIPLIWLNEDPRRPADTEHIALTAMQRETRRLLDLATRLFLARDLLRRGGGLAATVREAPERGIELLLDAVFGHSHRFRIRTPTGWRTFIAGHPAPLDTDLVRKPPPAASLLGELARQLSRPGEPVLVLNASVPNTAWVAKLDRRWVFVQPDAMTLALLREHVIARQMAAGAVLHTEEPGCGWTVES